MRQFNAASCIFPTVGRQNKPNLFHRMMSWVNADIKYRNIYILWMLTSVDLSESWISVVVDLHLCLVVVCKKRDVY